MSADLHLLTNLVTLTCNNAGLTGTLDLHGITTLTTVDCNNNSISRVVLTGCTGLDHLNCASNPLNVGTTIDLSSCVIFNNLISDHCTSLQVVDMTNIGSMTGFITLNDCPALTTLTTPDVTNVDQDIRVTNCINLPALSFPLLAHVGGEIDFDGSGVITASFPALIDIGLVSSGKFNGSGATSLTTVTAPNLFQVVTGDCDFHGCTAMLSLSLPALSLTGSFFVNGCTFLSSLTFAGGLNMVGDFIANGCPALTTFSVIGWVPTLGSTLNFNGDALNSASIDTILASGVAAGMNGGTIDLSGGTNLSHASWSVGALADETTLTTNGVTVLSNP